jgi:hypothetical protein
LQIDYLSWFEPPAARPGFAVLVHWLSGRQPCTGSDETEKWAMVIRAAGIKAE